LSSEEQNQNTDSNKQHDTTYYERKKNIISGIDNSHLALGVAGLALGLGIVIAIPTAREVWANFTQRIQQQNPDAQQQLPNGNGNVEPYIAPTEPVQPVPVQQPAIVQPQPVQEEKQEQENEEDEDGLFHEKELRRRQKLMGRRPTGSRYESPFGKDIGGLG